jgi:hypothetical protein
MNSNRRSKQTTGRANGRTRTNSTPAARAQVLEPDIFHTKPEKSKTWWFTTLMRTIPPGLKVSEHCGVPS